MEDMTAIDDAERSERRDLKAGRRNNGGSIMQPAVNDYDTDNSATVAAAPWINQLLNGQGVRPGHYTLPTTRAADLAPIPQQQGRSVKAGRSASTGQKQQQQQKQRQKPAPVQQQQQQDEEEEEEEFVPQQRRSVKAGRGGGGGGGSLIPGLPETDNCMRRSNPAFNEFLNENAKYADPTMSSYAHLRGHSLAAPDPSGLKGWA